MTEIVGLIILGLALGSFVNAVVWRVHEQAKTKRIDPRLSIWRGRSMCPNCRHTLTTRDLVPVFSWLSLKGKCRYCRRPISAQYPIVELMLPFLFLLSYFFWPAEFNSVHYILFSFWLVLLSGLLILAIYDLKWFLLPNAIIYPLFGVAIAQIVYLALATEAASLETAIWGLVVGGGLFYVLFQLSRGKWIGGGDVKLGALLGLIVGGPAASFLLLFIASLLGSSLAIPLIISGHAKRGSRLPFGPFLIVAGVIVRLFGSSIIDWYKAHFLV